MTHPQCSADTEPVAWRCRPLGANALAWQYSFEKPDGPSIHLFEVQPLYLDAKPPTAPVESEAMRQALNYIENTESELGIKLSCGDALREALAANEPKGAAVWQIGIASTTSDDVDWQKDWVTAETEEEASELAGCRGYYRNVRIRVASPLQRPQQGTP